MTKHGSRIHLLLTVIVVLFPYLALAQVGPPKNSSDVFVDPGAPTQTVSDPAPLPDTPSLLPIAPKPAESSIFGEYTLLAPIDSQTSIPISGAGFSAYLGKIFGYVIGLAGVATVLSLIVGGVEYIGSGTSFTKKQDADKRIQKSFIGLGLALGSYLILFTINPELVKFDLVIPQIQITKTAVTVVAVPPPIANFDAYQEIGTVSHPVNPTSDETPSKQAGKDVAFSGNVTDFFRKKAFDPTTGESKIVVRGKTSLDGLGEQAVFGLLDLQKNCKCTVTVTAGTEPGHATHGKNKDIVDLHFESDDKLSQFIIQNETQLKNGDPDTLLNSTIIKHTTAGVEYIKANGDIFRQEPNRDTSQPGNPIISGRHWHAILVGTHSTYSQ